MGHSSFLAILNVSRRISRLVSTAYANKTTKCQFKFFSSGRLEGEREREDTQDEK